MKAVTTDKQKNKLSLRIKNTYEGLRKGTIPGTYSHVWISFSTEDGSAHWEPTRAALREFIKKKGSSKFISPRKAYLAPEYTN